MSRQDEYEKLLDDLGQALTRANKLEIPFLAQLIRMSLMEACDCEDQFKGPPFVLRERCQDKS